MYYIKIIYLHIVLYYELCNVGGRGRRGCGEGERWGGGLAWLGSYFLQGVRI